MEESDHSSTDSHSKIQENIIHFKKINVFGSRNVGKKSLVKTLENYSNEAFKLEEEEGNPKTKTNNLKELKFISEVRQVKLVDKFNNKMHFRFYVTDLVNIDFIRMNFDTLFWHTEAIILMVDITEPESFKSVSKILELINQYTFPQGKNIVKFIITNKLDKESLREVSGFEIKELEDQNPDLISADVSLLEKENVDEVIKLLWEQLYFNGVKRKDKDIPYDSVNLVRVLNPPSLFKSVSRLENDLKASNKDFQFPLSLFTIGSGAVGKTCFINKFFEVFIDFENRISTIGVDVAKTYVNVNDNLIRLEVWDTVGQERFKAVQRNYYQKSDGFFLIFDVCSKSTFNDVVDWLKEIRENCSKSQAEMHINGINGAKEKKNEAIILIGNKIDKVNEREVDKKTAQQFAIANGIKYFEVSVKSDVNVYEAFIELIFDAYLSVKSNIQNMRQTFKMSGMGNGGGKRKCCG